MMKNITLFAILLFVPYYCCALGAVPRLAVVPGGEPKPLELLVLAESKLFELEGIEMLERNEIDKILNEQKMSGLFDVENAVQLGKILRVDLFAVLEPHSIIVYDAKTGLRYADETLSEDLEKAAGLVAESVDESIKKRKKLSARELTTFGVLEIRNADFPLERDIWCRAVAGMLERELLRNGAAVLERSRLGRINRERELSGDDTNDLLASMNQINLEFSRGEKSGSFRLSVRIGEKIYRAESSIEKPFEAVRELSGQLIETKSEEKISRLEAPARWAIFSGSDFGDLLTTELSAIKDIELLDRSEIDKVISELEISAILSPKEVAKRLELGRILSADRLLVLHKEKDSQKIRTVIFDTKTAARIFETEFRDESEQTAKAIASVVQSVQKSFRDGVRTVLAVTDFVSKSTSDDFSVYGESFPRILSLSLLQENGIAVVSFEEFSAIQKELEISGTNIERSVPLLVSGEFSGTKKNDVRIFDLKITVSDGLKDLGTFFKEKLTEQKAASFLSGDILKSIMYRLGNEDFTPLSLEEQEARFSEIAYRLHEYGAFEQSIKYREAILLFNPKNTLERLRLIDEIAAKNQYRKHLSETYPHIRHLFENRSISVELGDELYRTFVFAESNYIPDDERNRAEFNRIEWELLSVLPGLPPAEKPSERFLSCIWREKLDPPHNYLHDRYTRRAAMRYTYLLGDSRDRNYTKDILNDLIPIYERLPLSIIPFTRTYWTKRFLREDEKAALEFVQKLRKSKKKNLDFAADFTELFLEIEVREEISDSSLEKIGSARKKLTELTPPDYNPEDWNYEDISFHVRALDAFEKTVLEELYGLPERGPVGPLTFASPVDIESEKASQIELSFSIEPIAEWSDIVEEHFILEDSVENTAILLEKLDENTDVIWNNRTICLLQKDAEERITARRIHRTSADSPVLALCSDGRNIWYAKPEGIFCMNREGEQITHFGEKDGLPEFSLENHRKRIYIITLTPIAPDDILLCGRFGINGKNWIARLVRDSQTGDLDFKLLLEAYRISNNRDDLHHETYAKNGGAFDLAFYPSFINGNVRLGQENKSYVIIGRYFAPFGWGMDYAASPLLIDLETNRVSSLEMEFPDLRGIRGGQNCVSCNGSLVHVRRDHSGMTGMRDPRLIGHYSTYTSMESGEPLTFVNLNDLIVCTPPANEGDKWTKIEIAGEPLEKEGRFRIPSVALLKEGNIVYSPGFPWLKLDFSSGSLELEEIGEMSYPFSHSLVMGHFGRGGKYASFSYYRDSAVFGVWAAGILKEKQPEEIDLKKAYRIDWNKPMKQKISISALYVPMDKLPEHEAAASRIRSLGGFVENNSRFELIGTSSLFEGTRSRDENNERTVVALTSDWKGSGEDLELMKNLYRFEELYIIDRKLSREEVKAIGTCNELTGLYFIRSTMDREDLKFLPWYTLENMVLDSSEQEPGFDDSFLKTVFEEKKKGKNPRYNDGIYRLILCGPGFTEETFKLFTEIYFPQNLRLLNTKISEGSINNWNKKLSKEGESPLEVAFE